MPQSVEPAQLAASSTGPAWFHRLPFAPWGWRELNLYGWPLLAAVATLAALGDVWRWLALVPGALLAQLLYFFRDPPRQVPEEPAAIVAPADGAVVEVTHLEHDEFVGGPAVRIGIFLSIFDVHVNRAPWSASVVELRYKPGEFLNALRPESTIRNESMWIGLAATRAPYHRLVVRQISGAIARRIVCPLKPGQTLSRGEKFGMIKLGSRTELILPAEVTEVVVEPGMKVRAGRDTVARWTTPPP